MRLATREQAYRIDQISQEEYGLSAEVLMEAAGTAAAREIDQTFLPELARGNIGIVSGTGNNGADGLVVARHLHSLGHRDLAVFLVGPREARSSLVELQLQRAKLHGLRIVDLNSTPEKEEQIKECGLIVDAVFGIGLKRAVEAPFLSVIEAMNAAKAPKVSLDAPSGLNVNTGKPEGVAVRATMTVSFGLGKTGFYVSEGPAHVGKLRLLPIGFPFEALRKVATSHFLFDEKLARRYLPTRLDTANKSHHGKLLVLAGREGYWGAGVLATTSAFRLGAGYVQWASFTPPYAALKEIPEVLTGQVSDPSLWDSKFSAVCIGPGLGVSEETARLIEKLKSVKEVPVVVDADAITACVNHDLFPLPRHWVVTPHAGELSRILQKSALEIESDRFHAVLKACEKTGCHVLLKGFRSLVAVQERCMVIHSGNSALAKAGTGDVLSGMIGALLAQGLETLPAAAAAAYLHGRLADEWLRDGKDKISLTASDLKEILPQVISRLRSGGGLYA